MQDYRKLRVWQGAHAIVLEIYALSKRFPSEERFGLTAQLRRSGASMAANIAEGAMRGSDAAFGHFLQIAAASASEVDYHLQLAADLGYMDASTHERIERELRLFRRTLSALRTKVRKGAKGEKEDSVVSSPTANSQ